jgi:hypothetical protein
LLIYDAQFRIDTQQLENRGRKVLGFGRMIKRIGRVAIGCAVLCAPLFINASLVKGSGARVNESRLISSPVSSLAAVWKPNP